MKLSTLLTDDEAVSPVIGIILMVAITVILAAVIASFVLGVGGSIDEGKQASFAFQFDGNGNGFVAGDGDDAVTVTHRGGDTLKRASLDVVVDDTRVSGSALSGWSTEITAGDSQTVTDGTGGLDMASGDTVRLVWTGDGTSATLETTTVP